MTEEMNLAKSLHKKPLFWVDWRGPGGPAVRLWKTGEAVGIPVRFGTAKNEIRQKLGQYKYQGPWIPHGLKALRIVDVVRQEVIRTSPEETWALLQSYSPRRKKKRRYYPIGRKGPVWAYRYQGTSRA